jgi:hypothetical protein
MTYRGFPILGHEKPWDNFFLRVRRVMILPKEVVLLLNIGMPISGL